MKATFVALGSVATVSCVNLQREPLLSWSPSAKDPPFKMNYFVPNFGEDHDISSSKGHMAASEGKLGAWNPKQSPEDHTGAPEDSSAVWKQHWLLPSPDVDFILKPKEDEDYGKHIYGATPNCYANARACW